ncbi:MAG: hypothetical protein JSV71_04380 [Nitrospiraceae bacterium]|nr:MAG: hypothetical protein JSV71_04380 [Nitrospiraceae bacterium]
MKHKFEAIVKDLIGSGNNSKSLTKLHISEQFNPEEDDIHAVSRNINAAFLIVLSGESHELFREAREYLEDFLSHPSWKIIVKFYQSGLELLPLEISQKCSSDPHFETEMNDLSTSLTGSGSGGNQGEYIDKIYKVFFPEGVSLIESGKRMEKMKFMREKRKITISRLNQTPIVDPVGEVLFTSNILITIPSAEKNINELPVNSYLKKRLQLIIREEQMYWYDHPIPIGVAPEHNEILHGLEGLDRAVEFEKQQGRVDRDARLNCVLSVSVTHEGLQSIVKEYLEDEIKREKNIRNLNIFVITEEDTIRMIQEIIIPAAEKFSGAKEHGPLFEVIGVDGEYGRHFSFLKAIAAFWEVFIDRDVKGTFKIDLDQVFPQEELVEQSGISALEHLKTPLWGAKGIDSEGHEVELGMIAGALVNEKDIRHSLFYPDVRFPDREIRGDELIFNSTLPQALSTEAEMMTRYSAGGIDGKNKCLQRIHVTGGTSGVLIDSLRKYRPFTPTFIGRAEDQAYILSILFDGKDRHLRYVHKDGLIMRHDKEAFASEAMKAAAIGKLIGDYVRILMFSHYVRALPWSFQSVKNAVDPFTGCFVSRIPLTVVYLRFALKAASFFEKGTEESREKGFEFLQLGIRRLHEAIQELTGKPDSLGAQFRNEKQGWNIFYDTLDSVEKGIQEGDVFAHGLRDKAKNLIRNCRINFKREL